MGPAPNALFPKRLCNSPQTLQIPHTPSLLPKMHPYLLMHAPLLCSSCSPSTAQLCLFTPTQDAQSG